MEIGLAAILYVMFRPVHQALSLAAAFARLGEAMVHGVNMLTSGLVLLLLGGAGLGAFSAAQREALGLVFLDANAFMVLVWGIFFGFHLLVLGYLVGASRFLPRWIGVLLVVAGAGYLAQSCGTIMWPAAKATLDALVVATDVLDAAHWNSIPGVATATLT